MMTLERRPGAAASRLASCASRCADQTNRRPTVQIVRAYRFITTSCTHNNDKQAAIERQDVEEVRPWQRDCGRPAGDRRQTPIAGKILSKREVRMESISLGSVYTGHHRPATGRWPRSFHTASSTSGPLMNA